MQCNRYRVGRSTPSGGSYVQTVPDRIEVMRLSKLDKVFSVAMKDDRNYFAISQQGDLAVVEGSILRMYGLGR